MGSGSGIMPPNGDHHNLAKEMNRLSSNAQAVAARISMPNITS